MTSNITFSLRFYIIIKDFVAYISYIDGFIDGKGARE